MFWHISDLRSEPMSGVPVVGRYVSRSWSSGSSSTTQQQQQQQQDAAARHTPSPRRVRSTASRTPTHAWRIPAFFRRKFEIAQRGGGRVGSSAGEGGVESGGEAFKDHHHPHHKDPLKDPMIRPSTSREPIKEHLDTTPSPYTEPEILDAGSREPRYLDLFDPGVSVVRDPKLDQPPPTPAKSRASSALHACLATLASTRVIIGCTVVVIVLVVVIVTLATTSHRSLFLPDPRVQPPYVTTVTTCGIVKGKIEDGTFVFRGVPYALPPLGKLRFRPAQLHTRLDDCWEGTYTANKVQPCWGYDSRGGVVTGWEDCLLVDIFTPQLGYDNPLPVIVYVGGEGLGGDGGRAFTVGAAGRVARDRGVVVVSPQVRRGPLGFLPHPLLAASTYPHTSGNQGGSDLYAALVWTKRNIEHFGGSPTDIILLGHQGGAGLMWSVLSSPRTHKLVRAAWLSGAAPRHPTTPWRQADPGLVSQLNCSSVLCLQSVSPEDVMEAVSPERRHDTSEPWMVSDGVVVSFVPAPPPITLMIGSPLQGTAHRLLSWHDRVGSSRRNLVDAVVEALQTHKGKDEEEEEGAGESFGRIRWPSPPLRGNRRRKVTFDSSRAERAIEWYSDLQGDPWRLLTTLVSDATVTCPALEKAATLARTRSRSRHNTEDVPVYSYVTRYERTSRAGQVADGLSDIEAILGVFEEHNESDAKFSKTLQDLFFLFVHAGMPERHGAMPAHLGVYTVDETVTVMRSRLACAHWVNMSQLATRY